MSKPKKTDYTKLRNNIIANLRNGPAKVTFIKEDGSERVMHCTLEKKVVPKTDEDYNNLPGSTVIAWDLEKKAWRSFRVDSVTEVKPA